LYLFYMLIDVFWIIVAWLDANQTARERLKRFWWMLPMLPLYRMMIFWFRFSGFLHAVSEPGSWRVQNPVVQVRNGLRQEFERLQKLWGAICVRFRLTGRTG
jgi:biofilm PGA synthesis N-glycosyltransferase PgaC